MYPKYGDQSISCRIMIIQLSNWQFTLLVHIVGDGDKAKEFFVFSDGAQAGSEQIIRKKSGK